MKRRRSHSANETKLVGKIALAVAFVLCALSASSTAQEAGASRDWPKGAPKEFGIDPQKLAAFDADIAGGKYGLVDSMLVLRCGTAVYDKSYPHDYGQIYGERAKKEGLLAALGTARGESWGLEIDFGRRIPGFTDGKADELGGVTSVILQLGSIEIGTEVDVAKRVEISNGQAELVGDEEVKIGKLGTAAGEEDALGRCAVERGAVVGDGAVDVDVEPGHGRPDQF